MLKLNLYKSDKPSKKYYVEFINPNTNRLKRMYFGAENMNDYTITGDDEAKERYIKRHKARERWDTLSPGMLSRFLLWNKPTLTASIKDTNKRFNNIKIINKTNKTGGRNPLTEKHSAYRSMKLSEMGLTKPTTAQNKGKLRQWQKEMWENLTARITDGDKFYNCGTKGKEQIKKGLPSVCRPSKKINKTTPTPLSNQLSKKQILKAIKEKQKGNRVDWKSL
jgi:hypothetical protein